MGNKKDGGSRPFELFQTFKTADLESHIPDGQNLIDQEEVHGYSGCDGKFQSRVHAIRVLPNRHIEILSQAGEGEDRFDQRVSLLDVKPKFLAFGIDVFTTGQHGLQTAAKTDQRRHVALT